jgi:hypothetical protein
VRPESNNRALQDLYDIIARVDLYLIAAIVPEEAWLEEEERRRARRIAIREAGLEPAIMRLDKAIGLAAAAFADGQQPLAHALRIDALLSRLLDLLSHANPIAFGYDRSADPGEVDCDERVPLLIATLREIFPRSDGTLGRM